jgi:hypothetical protein
VAHIFISYASEDRARAKEVAIDLQALGWDVWWDRELQAGKTFAGVIESEIKRSGCVLVLWSKASIASRWVRDEANEGLARDILVPALIERVEPPMGFRSIHAADLIDYHGDQNTPGFRKLVADLAALLGPPPRRGQPPPVRREPRPEPVEERGGWLRKRWPVAAGAALVVALGAWGVARYVGDVERRAADLEARQRAFEDKSRRAEEEAAKRQAAEAEAARRAAEKSLQAAAAAEKERQSALENERLAAAERQRAADADAARKADAERARAAADAAARKAEEERRRLAAAAKSPAKPPPPAEATPEPRVPEPATPARVEAPAPQPPPPVAARSPLVPVPGDTWSYRYVDGFRRGEVDRLTYRVEGVGAAGIDETLRVQKRPDYSSRITVPREPRFVGHTGLEYAPPDFAPYLQAFQALEQGAALPAVKRVFTSDATIPMTVRVAGREQVTVPAGTFDAIKVVAEGRGETFINRIPMHSIITIWYAPEARRFVKFDARTYERTLPQELSTFELVDYKLVK